jgi:hypothetical protein
MGSHGYRLGYAAGGYIPELAQTGTNFLSAFPLLALQPQDIRPIDRIVEAGVVPVESYAHYRKRAMTGQDDHSAQSCRSLG